MALEEHLQVFIHFFDTAPENEHYDILKTALNKATPSNTELPVFHEYQSRAVAITTIPAYLMGILQGHIIIRGVYAGPIPLGEIDKLPLRLQKIAFRWNDSI